jgi:hypothetical protein
MGITTNSDQRYLAREIFKELIIHTISGGREGASHDFTAILRGIIPILGFPAPGVIRSPNSRQSPGSIC